MLLEILSVVFFVEVLVIFLWKIKAIRREYRITQHETDLRLTYKRYKELYPDSIVSYPEYKKMQTQKAYKKAVSSMKIKRMVR